MRHIFDKSDSAIFFETKERPIEYHLKNKEVYGNLCCLCDSETNGPQGIGPQGVGPQGIGPQGIGPQGIPEEKYSTVQYKIKL